MLRTLSLAIFGLFLGGPLMAQEPDPFLWLEDVEGAKPVAWVKEHNARTIKELEAVKEYQPVFKRILTILDSKDRIPAIAFHGNHVYNFWQDAAHQRGLWRRTTLAAFRTAAPDWETVLDIDALGRQEGRPWVFKGASFLEPDCRYALVQLSRGGGDAVEIREFDTRTRTFVDSGFALPEAKSALGWHDADTLWVATDFGPGSMTTSGYARIVKLWKRGTPLSDARTVYEGRPEDVEVTGYTIRDPASQRLHHLVSRNYVGPRGEESELFLHLGGRLVKLDIPVDTDLQGIFMDRLLLSPRSDWTAGGRTHAMGSLLAIHLDAFLQGSRALETLFEPGERVSLTEVGSTRRRLLLLTLDNVESRMYSLLPDGAGWKKEEIPLPGLGNAALGSIDGRQDRFTFTYTDFLTPTSLFLHDGTRVERLKTSPAFFKAAGMKVGQLEATSRDGTRIPYFVVYPRGFTADGSTPTVLSGYGGFQVPSLPYYSARDGAAWLERGGAYVLANIRGGGEFGPRWHQAAQKHNRMKGYEDFIAVAEDLIARKITSREHLGIEGGSQGGLLVGGAFTLRPDLFKAVLCGVPLADMQRYHKLLAGASWMSEYGDPDKPEDWAVIKTYSPYQLLKKDAAYPMVFFWTTTRDDRVHPAHARKMAAKMEALGHPVYYFENMEGGHGAGSTSRQQAQALALHYAYLWKLLR